MSGSSPSTRAAIVRPSGTASRVSRAPCTTWLLVSTRPSGEITTPEPRPPRRPALASPTVSDAHHRGADPFDHVDQGLGIGVEQRRILRGGVDVRLRLIVSNTAVLVT